MRQFVLQGLPDDQDAHVGGGVLGDGPTLRLEDPAVDAEEVAALHARLARDGADQQAPTTSRRRPS